MEEARSPVAAAASSSTGARQSIFSAASQGTEVAEAGAEHRSCWFGTGGPGTRGASLPSHLLVGQSTVVENSIRSLPRELLQACTHRSCHPIDSHELTLEDMTETYACFHEAFQKWAPGAWLNHQNPVHECTNQCHLFNHREVYVCCSNGNMHVCNEMACDRAVDSHEGRSCEVTGKLYSLDFQYSFDDGVQCASYSQRRSSKVSSSINSSQMQQQQTVVAVPPQSTSAPQQLKIGRRRGGGNAASDGSLRVFTADDIRNQIDSLVRKLVPLLSAADATRTGERINEVYSRLMRVHINQTHSSSTTYTLAMHVVIVLHLMASGGLTYLGDVFVPMDAAVSAAMPGRGLQTLLANIERSVRQHTDMMHAFSAYMDKWCRQFGSHSMITPASQQPRLSPF